ncbi:MAG: glycerophosphodiester phosphodiesterase family protein, partial [Acidobacteriota bacterium]
MSSQRSRQSAGFGLTRVLVQSALFCSALVLMPPGGVSADGTRPQAAARKQLIAHRGASAYAPEHTPAAYTLAITQGADFVEPDLAVTKDGVLICIHDLTLERTTNVEEVFPDRSVADAGTPASSAPPASPGSPAPRRRWLVHDFTLAEIKRLDAGSWFDAKFAGARIQTFQEAIDLVRGKAGLYPELKDPEFYRQRGVHPETLLAAILQKNNLVADPKTPVIIQSFDDTTLKQLAKDLPRVPRVFLVDPLGAGRLDSVEKMREIATWANGVAPNKVLVDRQPALVGWAHAAGLTVTPWTFSSANTGAFASVKEEMAKFLYDYGVDALFT